MIASGASAFGGPMLLVVSGCLGGSGLGIGSYSGMLGDCDSRSRVGRALVRRGVFAGKDTGLNSPRM